MLTLRPLPNDGRGNGGTARSFVAAALLTAAMLAIVLVTSGRLPAAWWRTTDTTRPTREEITYVTPAPAPVPIPAPPPPVPLPARSRRAEAAGVPGGAPTTTAPTVVPNGIPTIGAPTAGPVPIDTGARATGRGAPGAGAGPRQSPLPMQVGAARPVAPPLTGAQMDSVLRVRMGSIFTPAAIAEAKRAAADAKEQRDDEYRREVGRAAHGSAPYYHGIGVSIPVFGGPSAAERRKRDSADADTKARLARIAERAKADSIRKADSLRRFVP